MKKVLFGIILLINISHVLAQSQNVQPGAKWTYEEVYYEFWGPPSVHYSNYYIIYTGDTLINGHQFQKLESNYYAWHDTVNYIALLDSALFLLSNKDSTDLMLMFDFNLQPQDSFFLVSHDGNPVVVYIDSIYQEEINGIMTKTYKAFYMSMYNSKDTLHIDFNDRLGPLNHFLFITRVIWFVTDECWNCFTLRCYEDDEMPLYNPEGIPCDSIRPGTTSIEVPDEVTGIAYTLYPNPTSDQVVLQFSEAYRAGGTIRVRIRHVSGQLVYDNVLALSSQYLDLPVSHLTGGLYLVEVRDDGGSLLSVEKLVIAP